MKYSKLFKITFNIIIQDNRAVLFHKDDVSGSLAFLDRVESSFYRLSVNWVKATSLDLKTEIDQIYSSKKFRPPKIRPVKSDNLSHRERTFSRFDTSVLEPSRLPDIPVKSFLSKLKKVNRPLASEGGTNSALMLKVRESYLPSSVKQTIEYDQEKRRTDPVLGVERRIEKKVSIDSLSSSKSSNSGPRAQAMSRGAGFIKLSHKARQKTVETQKSLVEDTREAILSQKARKTKEIEQRICADINTTDTEALIDRLVIVKNDIVKAGEAVALASCAEATVSILLKHLDMVGISKTNLEELVGSRLLCDVPTISRRYGATEAARLAKHKVQLQVFLRAEVHWLLANQQKQQVKPSRYAHGNLDC